MENQENVGGMLSDNDIKKYWGKGIKIFSSESGALSFDLDKQLQFGSIDLHFRHEYKKIKLSETDTLTYEKLKAHDYTNSYELKNNEKLRILPGEMIVTITLETVQFSEEFAGLITGRSSMARIGIMVHCCQEFINPGHGQPIPLQIINLAPCPVELDLTVPVCQLIIFKLHSPSSGRYKDNEKAKYANETNPQNSKIYQEMMADSEKTSNRKLLLSIKQKVWYCVKKYISPFCPSLIMSTLITPVIIGNLSGRSIGTVWSSIGQMPMLYVIGIVCIIVFVLGKKGEK